MKKFFALLAVVLAVVSCQKDVDNLDVNMGGDVATISVVLPADAITRAAANETDSAWSGLQNVKDETLRVIFQVYDENGETNENLRQVKTLNEGELTANFNVRLVPDRQYTFVAWADQGEEYFDVTDLKDVKLLSWEAMDECRDAFTDTHTEKKFNSASNITLKLTRPFAKLRVITTDMEQLGHLNIAPAEAEVAYTVELPNAFNAFAGEACATTAPKSFTTFDIAEYNQDAANTKTLFTDYILVPANNVVKFSLKTMQDGGREIKTNNFNTDIPVECNNLTTIMGNVLT
ncbi:MAG: FimB/Mfa2 family fimbrial subunit, partial [Alistipes sp.]|nr:FimB/Mfa2 family fimbrial subunit [Alistipes sp.]